MNFSSFSFDDRINAGITAAGYQTPTPIQEQAIPPILLGRDLLGIAQTGTGKTAAFVLPILQRLLGGERCTQRALILSPTRELAEQTYKAIENLGHATGLKSMTVFGGVSLKSQIKTLKNLLPEIIVACPGRLLDLMGQGVIRLNSIEVLVLDEADQMLDMGFIPSVKKIVAAIPKSHQTLLFSATLPSEIRSLAREFQRDPARVEIGGSKPVETVSHFVYQVGQADKYEALKILLEQKIEGQALIFTRTKHRAKKLALQLAGAGHSATALQGNLSQAQREKAMASFRSGKSKIMVATDIAARGIDISHISHVINFDVPDTTEAYTHRIGRTGRMMHKGIALTFITPEDAPMLRSIERVIGAPIERRVLDGFVPAQAHAIPFDARTPGAKPEGAAGASPKGVRPGRYPKRAEKADSGRNAQGRRFGANAPAQARRPNFAGRI